jgi:hypothetical protein
LGKYSHYADSPSNGDTCRIANDLGVSDHLAVVIDFTWRANFFPAS